MTIGKEKERKEGMEIEAIRGGRGKKEGREHAREGRVKKGNGVEGRK